MKTPVTIAPEALDFTRLIRSGETVGWAEATAEPTTPRIAPCAVHTMSGPPTAQLASCADAGATMTMKRSTSRFGSPLVPSRVHRVRPELVAEVKYAAG